jgi:hypothetical protein
MKKAPHNLPAAGALGEQLTSIDPPTIPDVSRSVIKGMICTLANAGLITDADAQNLIHYLGLGDA